MSTVFASQHQLSFHLTSSILFERQPTNARQCLTMANRYSKLTIIYTGKGIALSLELQILCPKKYLTYTSLITGVACCYHYVFTPDGPLEKFEVNDNLGYKFQHRNMKLTMTSIYRRSTNFRYKNWRTFQKEKLPYY